MVHNLDLIHLDDVHFDHHLIKVVQSEFSTIKLHFPHYNYCFVGHTLKLYPVSHQTLNLLIFL